jgi:hypothetical protein
LRAGWKGSADGVDQLLDARDFSDGHKKVTVVWRDPEAVTPPQELLLRGRATGRIMHPNVVHVHAVLVLTVEPADVRLGAMGLEYDGHTMQGLMSWMKDMSRHCVPAQTAAAK